MIDHILTLLIAIPFLGAIAVAAFPDNRTGTPRLIALVTLGLEILATVVMYILFVQDQAGFQPAVGRLGRRQNQSIHLRQACRRARS